MINEVQYNPPQSGPDADFECIELYNPSASTVAVEGWTVRDNYESDPIPSLTIPAKGFAVIAATEQGFRTNFPDLDGDIVFLGDGSVGNGLSNDGDCLILADSAGNVIDVLSYGSDSSQSPHYSGVAEGHSLERWPPRDGFVDNPDPTPGSGLSFAPTPAATTTQTKAPTTTPTTVAPGTPTPQGKTPLQEATSFSGVGLRAIFIAAALALVAIVLLIVKWRSKK